jgi:RalA-binding protein 1
MAALEAILQERNTLASQNAQLWKLIEKQRSGYNQILKELERVRGERDAYRTKLGVNPAEKRHRTQSVEDETPPSRLDDHGKLMPP